jgi:hypothetical protein
LPGALPDWGFPLSSVSMHWLDRAAVIAAARLAPNKRPFNLGWGDESIVEFYLENAGTVPPIAPITPTVRPARRTAGVIIRDLEFDSPFEMLPEESQRVRGRWVTTHPEPDRVAILHAAWNDEDYRTRGRIARALLAKGIASVMLQHPLYGDRRHSAALDVPVPFVSDFCLMGRGGVLEGRSLARWLIDSGYRVGVSGYSMGGNIAGFVGVLVDRPVAIAPLAAPYAAGPPFIDGVLRRTVAWDALGGETPEVIDRLSRVVHAGSLLDHPPPPHAAAAVILAATRDGFIPTAAALAIHRHWPGSEMDWVNAGHASMLLTKRDRMVAAIVRSFDRLDEHIGRFASTSAG